MKNKLMKTLSLGLSSLMLVLMVFTATPINDTTITLKNPTHGVSPLEDPPW